MYLRIKTARDCPGCSPEIQSRACQRTSRLSSQVELLLSTESWGSDPERENTVGDGDYERVLDARSYVYCRRKQNSDDHPDHKILNLYFIARECSKKGESIFGNDRSRKSSFKGIFTAVTNTRIAIAIPQYLGDDERHIPYHSVTSVDLDTGLAFRRISVQTKGQTYHIQANGPSKDELREAVKFIRKMVKDTHQSQQAPRTSEFDPTEQLRNLKGLHDDEILTKKEFEQKKVSY